MTCICHYGIIVSIFTCLNCVFKIQECLSVSELLSFMTEGSLGGGVGFHLICSSGFHIVLFLGFYSLADCGFELLCMYGSMLTLSV